MKGEFQRGHNPRTALDIGGVSRNYMVDDIDEISDLVFRLGPAILGQKDWTEDNINQKGYHVRKDHIKAIRKWVSEHVTFKNSTDDPGVEVRPGLLSTMIKMHLNKNTDKKVDESDKGLHKFKRNMNPRTVLDIGTASRVYTIASYEEFQDLIFKVGPAVLGQREWTEESINEPGYYIRMDHLKRLTAWAADHIILKDYPPDMKIQLSSANLAKRIKKYLDGGNIKESAKGRSEFKRNMNPRKTLDIGIASRTYKVEDHNEFQDLIFRVGSAVLGQREWTEESVNESGHYIREDHLKRLRDWSIDHVILKGYPPGTEIRLSPKILEMRIKEYLEGGNIKESATGNLEFKRGGDPKDKLGIGLLAPQKFNSIEEFIKWADKALSTIYPIGEEGIRRILQYSLDARNAAYKIEFMWYEKEILHKLKQREDLYRVKSGDFLTLEEMEREFYKWPNQIRGHIHRYVNGAIKGFAEKKGIFESSEFKRGRDPRDTLGIGLLGPQRFGNIYEFRDWAQKAFPILFSISEKALEAYRELPDEIKAGDSEFILRHGSWGWLEKKKIENAIKERTDLYYIVRDRSYDTLKNIFEYDYISTWIYEVGEVITSWVRDEIEKIVGNEILSESIRFKRSTNPREALKIGILASQTFKDRDDFCKWLGVAIPLIVPNWEKRSREIARGMNSEIADDAIETRNIFINEIIDILSQRDDLYEQSYGRLKDASIIRKKWYYWHEWARSTINKMIMGFRDRRNIDEGIEFKRGVGARESIGIGLASPQKFNNIDEFTKWIKKAAPVISPDILDRMTKEIIENNNTITDRKLKNDRNTIALSEAADEVFELLRNRNDLYGGRFNIDGNTGEESARKTFDTSWAYSLFFAIGDALRHHIIEKTSIPVVRGISKRFR